MTHFPKLPRSLGARVSFWFAGLALLTALILGGVLLATLREYYARQEAAYLESNAGQMAALAGQLIEAGVSPAELSDQVRSWSFLLQTRIEIYDAAGTLLADSGIPDNLQVVTVSGGLPGSAPFEAGSGGVTLFETPLLTGSLPAQELVFLETGPVTDVVRFISADPFLTQTSMTTTLPGSSSFVISIGAIPGSTSVVTASTALGSNPPLAVVLPLAGSLQTGGSGFGYSFNNFIPAGENVGAGLPIERSRMRLEQAILSSSAVAAQANPGQTVALGRLVLSSGPAYGQAIFLSALRAWAIAGTAAVMCAALAGIWVSRRLTRPLVALTAVTTRMAAGDLSARAAMEAEGESALSEVGTLGRSFNEMAGQVEHTVQTLRSFVADAAHELQTPLTALRTTLELASSQVYVPDSPEETNAAHPVRPVDPVSASSAPAPHPDPVHPAHPVHPVAPVPLLPALLAQAEAQRQRLQTLAASLLELSRLEAGGELFNPAPTALDSPLSSLAERAASRAEQAGLTFSYQAAPPEIPLPVPLQHAVENLLDNAIKFTPPGGTVTLTVSKPEAAGPITILVADTGIGISPEDLPQVGRRFFRGNNAAAYPGSGLGLAIVQATAARFGGALHIASSPSGTTATLTFPEIE